MAKRTPKPVDPNKLIRESPGRYRSPDERFTVQQESAGAWYVADAEHTDELGLPLIRGPFATLQEAREGVVAAREAPPPEPRARPAKPAKAVEKEPTEAGGAAESGRPSGRRGRSPKTDGEPAPTKAPPPPKPAEPELPAWLARLSPAQRREAELMTALLRTLGIEHPEPVVRRELEGDEPAIAATLLDRRIEERVVQPWGAGGWLRAVTSGRGPLREHRATVERLIASGVDREALAALAASVADAAAEGTRAIIDTEGFDPETGKPPRGWRLVELDATGQPTGRKVPRD